MPNDHMRRPDRLPDEAVWSRVRDYAENVRRNRSVVPTLTFGVPNKIIAVDDRRILRSSPRVKRSHSTITKGQVLRAWREISRPGGASPRGWYFLRPLLVNACPGIVRHQDGWMWLDGDPNVEAKKRRIRDDAKQHLTGTGWGGGEGVLHRALKEFVMRQPNVALRGLHGSPFVAHDTEYLFPTGDEVDVRLSDRDGRPVLVEIKPNVDSRSLAAWGQAAKYRTLFAFFHDIEPLKVRVVVVAPAIPASLARRMLKSHAIESLAVTPPRVVD